METYKIYIIGLGMLSVAGCTPLSEGQESMPDDIVLNERVTLRPTPEGTLGRQMGGLASEINRKRNIEEFDRNGPAMTPNALRPRQLPYSPIDSTRHNIYWPIRPVIRPIIVNQ